MNNKLKMITVTSIVLNIILIIALTVSLSNNNSDKQIIEKWTSDVVSVETCYGSNISHKLTGEETEEFFSILYSASEFKDISYDSQPQFSGVRASFRLTNSNGVKIILIVTDVTLSENLGHDYFCDAETLDKLVSLYNEFRK